MCTFGVGFNALGAKYSTHKGRKVQAIAALQAQINTPAPKLFLFKATTAWAIPQMKGARPKVATSVSVEIPIDAPEWRREAALAAGQVKVKRDTSPSADMIVLKDSFYDMNTWDNDGTPESTRRRWRQDIGKAADDLVNEALAHTADILEEEGSLIQRAACFPVDISEQMSAIHPTMSFLRVSMIDKRSPTIALSFRS